MATTRPGHSSSQSRDFSRSPQDHSPSGRFQAATRRRPSVSTAWAMRSAARAVGELLLDPCSAASQRQVGIAARPALAEHRAAANAHGLGLARDRQEVGALDHRCAPSMPAWMSAPSENHSPMPVGRSWRAVPSDRRAAPGTSARGCSHDARLAGRLRVRGRSRAHDHADAPHGHRGAGRQGLLTRQRVHRSGEAFAISAERVFAAVLARTFERNAPHRVGDAPKHSIGLAEATGFGQLQHRLNCFLYARKDQSHAP